MEEKEESKEIEYLCIDTTFPPDSEYAVGELQDIIYELQNKINELIQEINDLKEGG